MCRSGGLDRSGWRPRLSGQRVPCVGQVGRFVGKGPRSAGVPLTLRTLAGLSQAHVGLGQSDGMHVGPGPDARGPAL